MRLLSKKSTSDVLGSGKALLTLVFLCMRVIVRVDSHELGRVH